MAEMDQDEAMLDALFGAARAQVSEPSADLMARVLEDAFAAQVSHNVATVAARPRPGVLSRVMAAIGGWPALAGLATAGVAGLWIGVNPPTVISDTAQMFLGGSSDLYLVDLAPAFGFDLAEG
ncbi:hypothetical protein [Thalassovita taeanensis]|uniref:Dihydroorotate dehydrogenase n=1 Tax=Thalassovita taeanensis TaxID=657014 RepID=A0A1H9EPF7_9RHOB|nr:hypothetical protein [Thalassovita taeanensis]SEQ27600.1 hypothetical protein SAMN04488092_105126 [Thalassovita taeanensis]